MASRIGKATLGGLLGVLVSLVSVSASTQTATSMSYSGSFVLAASKANATRFMVQDRSVSLYATGDNLELLRELFFKKGRASLAYTSTTCPMGITGKCGTVTGVTIESAGF